MSNALTVYLMPREEVERLLAAKYGGKLIAVNPARLAKQNERKANWRKKSLEI